MRVVVTGASGNVGTSTLAALAEEAKVEEVVGIAERRPQLSLPKVRWAATSVLGGELEKEFRGADAVIHLAWAIQPSRDERTLRLVNVEGSRRVFEAAARMEVPAVVYASSVGAYSPGPKDEAVDESWPTGGVETSFYSRHKAQVESILDEFESNHPETRVVRLRPGLIFKGEAASEIRRLFIGPFLPNFMVRPSLIPLAPRIAGLRFQAVHSLDVGEAFRQATVRDARGAFNLAADPVIGPDELAGVLRARQVDLPVGLVRALTDLTWKLRLQPSPPGWLDMALQVPIMDSGRARDELGWKPRTTSLEALEELLHGLREGEGMATPPLEPRAGGPGRAGELKTGVGARSGKG
jgi:UDP-glucose 4-epimerase